MNTDKKPSILVVEDVHADIDILNHILKNDFDVHIAKTGRAALKIAFDYQPDLILLDIMLPDMTGFAVLSALKESNETRRLPVIIITGINNSQYEEKGLFHGAIDYITKPFQDSIVLARIGIHMQIVRHIHRISKLGLYDPLTALPNHRCFKKQIVTEWSRAVREKIPLSVLLVDIDGFKLYNETHGHSQGDLLLQRTSQTISESIKRPADSVARLRGDAFAVLLPNTDLRGAIAVAKDIGARMEKLIVPHLESDAPTSVTVSIGAASLAPSADDSLENFAEQAGMRLEAAVHAGGNRLVPSRAD